MPTRTTLFNIKQRFEEKILNFNGPPTGLNGECLLWGGSCDTKGYGVIKVDGRQVKATHVAYYLATDIWFVGEAGGMAMLHECNNPRCVQAAHLRVGTAQENRDDCVKSRRTATGEKNGAFTKPESVRSGEKNGRSKLTARDVVMIRRTCDEYQDRHGLYAFLGQKFQVTVGVVSDIARRKTWNDVPEDILPEITALPPDQVQCGRLKGEGCEHATITDLKYRQIRCLYEQCGGRHGAITKLAERYGIGKTSVERIVKRKDRQDLVDNFGELGNLEPLFPASAPLGVQPARSA
jgi:hypothetical protein